MRTNSYHSNQSHHTNDDDDDDANTSNTKGGSRLLSQKDNIRISREEFDDAFKWITKKCHHGRVTERHIKEQLFSIFGPNPKWTRKEFALLASDPDLSPDKLWSQLPTKNCCEAFDTVAEAFAGGFDEDLDGLIDHKMIKKMFLKIDEEYPSSSTSAAALLSPKNKDGTASAAPVSPKSPTHTHTTSNQNNTTSSSTANNNNNNNNNTTSGATGGNSTATAGDMNNNNNNNNNSNSNEGGGPTVLVSGPEGNSSSADNAVRNSTANVNNTTTSTHRQQLF